MHTMRRFLKSVCVAGLVTGLLSLIPKATVADDDGGIHAFLQIYCVDCHGGGEPEAGLSLEQCDLHLDDADNFQLWAHAFSRVERGEMPPADGERPAAEERAAWLQVLEAALAQADRARQTRYGRSELRRLSRVEYANSLQDILGLQHLELAEMLPPDSLAHGYQKSARALDFSHVMISKYLEVADYALWQALAPTVESVPSKVVRGELKSVDGVSDTLQTLRVQLKQTTAMPLLGMERDPTLVSTKGNFAKRDPGILEDPEPHFDGVATFMNSRSNHNIVVKPFKVEQSGYYKLRVHGWGLLNDHGKLLPSDRHEAVAFYTPSGRLLGRCELPPNVPTTSEITAWLNADEPIEYLAISTDNELFNFANREGAKYEKFKAYGIGLQWLEMEGPQVKQWPPRSHRQLLGDLPLEATDEQPNGLHYRVVVDNPEQQARQLLGRFARQAYRRPLRNGDLQLPMKMVRGRLRRKEPFVDALLAGYRAILTSPEFLLLQEQPGPLDAWALASRLSFFLWNSPPDHRLRQAAASGALLEEDELRRQTERMLNDKRSVRFIEHFLDYWVDLRNIALTEPDKNLYPEYNTLLGESMVEETRAYFAAMLAEDCGVDHIVDSDFVTINQRLAELYGIDGVPGFDIRRVELPEETVRGGLLTQGSLLKITANGTTTSPVVRGTFVLSRLLGDPPPPPPPSVPAIEPDISGATTIREQLAQHRSIAACAACHQKIDPPGFALESFDVMGAWRTEYRALKEQGEKGVDLKSNGKPVQYKIGQTVDSAGELPDGAEFSDVNEFRALLADRQPQMARHLLEQFIVFATGTPVGFADRPVVGEMLRSLASRKYGVRSMVHSVVQSPLFRNK